MSSPAFKLSVLDQSPIAEGSTGAQALHNTIDLARLTEVARLPPLLGRRAPRAGMLAGASPEVLLAAIGAATTHMRIGSGGVMLPHYSPLKVAETFSVLSGLYGDRIDLGVGRAPGSDPGNGIRAPARPSLDVARRLPGAARRADGVPAGELPAGPPARAPGGRFRAGPSRRRSGCSARRPRARSGPPSSASRTRSPTSSTRPAPRSRASTASGTCRRPSTRTPELAIAVSTICAETDEEAERLAASSRMAITLLRRGRPGAVPPVDKALEFLSHLVPSELSLNGRRLVVGVAGDACASDSRRSPPSTAPARSRS